MAFSASSSPELKFAKVKRGEQTQAAEFRTKRRKRTCAQCGGGRRANTSRYCSKRCESKGRTLPRKPCPVCSKPIQELVNKTCSARCGYLLRKSSKRSEKACMECGSKYWPVPFNRTKFCSRRCYNAHKSKRPRLQSVSCEKCGTAFWRTAAALKRVNRSFCSMKCSQEYYAGEASPMHRGYKAHSWRGKGWNRLREQIRQRDGYRCQRCNKTQEENGYALPVDHIIPWHTFTDKAAANHPSNLVSLCGRCHGLKTTTAERKWLKGDVLAMQQYQRSIGLKPLCAAVEELEPGKGCDGPLRGMRKTPTFDRDHNITGYDEHEVWREKSVGVAIKQKREQETL